MPPRESGHWTCRAAAPGRRRSAAALDAEASLERAGYAVDCAADGTQGEFLGSTEQYDVAVLDLGLPQLPGLDVLRRWRAAGSMLPVIILTARDEWHERVEGLKAGADDNVSVNGDPLTQLSATRPHTPVFLTAGQNVIPAANGFVSVDYDVRDGGDGTCVLP